MKKKITVIGGGLGSLSFIYHLLQEPNAKELYEITVYQESWSLGGKGASGVNPEKGFRVEEHGIHFWFGFYENGFKMMREIYDALGRPPQSPLASFDDAFKPQKTMDFAQRINDEWTKWQITFPKLPGTIGDGEYLYPLDELIEIGIKLIGNEFSKIIHVLQPGCLGSVLKILKKKPKPNHNSHEKYLSNLEETIFKIIEHPIEKRLMAMAILYKNHEHYHDGNTKSHASFIHSVKKWIWDHIGDLVSSNPELLRVWCSIDFGLSVLKGIIEDGVLSVKDNKFVLDFTLINHIDFESWLVLHGADEKYLKNFPAVKSMYDGPFAFFKGAVSSPNVEAGTALNIFLRLALTCKQDVMWRMQAGMGDTIFAPIYEYLQINFKENVKFKFFHKIKDLQLDKDAQQVVSIEVEELIELADNISEYQPLVNVKGLQCWPSHPLYDQLNPDQVAKIKEQNIHIESNWSGWKGTMHTKNLNEDFDTVIIGASLSALPTFCTQLINNNQKWAKMLDKVGTVQTQAFQLWFTKSAEDLGVDPLQVLSTYVEPLDTFAAMNQVLEREDWSKYPEQPKYLMYVCGAFPDSESIPPAHATYFPKNQKNDVYDNMLVYIKENLKFIIPKAFDEDGNFDWDLLYDPTGGKGEDRLKFQYFRANINYTERYVFSLTGSSKHRLKTDETGYQNVFLTGDWIQNGMNIGFVEGATISGILTAKALATHPDHISLYEPW